MTVVIDTPDGFEHFRFCQVIASLSIEVSTGMSHSRGSILKLAQTRYGVTARTKAKALAQLKDMYETKYGFPYGGKK